MNKTGAPNYLWAVCSMYVVYLFNHLAQPGLKWRTPIEACYGYTPDISSLLQFSFFQKVYYLGAEIPFPSSKEKDGRFLGIAENVGDAMTFWIWTEDTEKLIARSVIGDAENPRNVNKRVELMGREEKAIESPKVVGIKDHLPGSTLPIIDPDHLVDTTLSLNMLDQDRKWKC